VSRHFHATFTSDRTRVYLSNLLRFRQLCAPTRDGRLANRRSGFATSRTGFP
jgi:hypothetical protein